MASPTPNKGYTYPPHGGSVNAWDAPLNTNFDTIDKNFGGSLTTVLTTGATILSTTDAQNAVYIFTGALTGNCTVQWPTVGGTYVIDNQCTGAFTVTLQNAGGGATVVAPQGKRIEIYSAGNDMKTVVNAADGDWYVPGDLDVDGIITTPEIDTDVVKSTNPYQQGGISLVLGHGQCVFQIASTTTCTLFPKNGNTIAFPAGGVVQLPSGGVSITNGGLSNGVLYYVYIDVGGTMSASTTSHTTDTATGIEVMTGDTTKVLVGMVYLVGGSFVDSGSTRLVASWFNRRPKVAVNSTGGTSTGSSTPAEVNTSWRNQMLCWGDEASCSIATQGARSGSNNGNAWIYYISQDGASSSFGSGQSTPSGSPTTLQVHATGSFSPSEGYHYYTFFSSGDIGQTITFNTYNGLTTSAVI